MNNNESELTAELLSAQHLLAEMYQTNLALNEQHLDLTRRMSEISSGQAYSLVGKPSLKNDHAIDLHIEETLRLRPKKPFWMLMAWLLSSRIRRLRLFDFQWYLDRYPDIQKSGIRPFKHFLMHGIFEGRDPSPRFNTRVYLAECLHMLNPGEPAFFHYLRRGRSAGIPASLNSVYPGTRFIAARLSALEEQMSLVQEHVIEHSTSLETNRAEIERLADVIASTRRSITRLGGLVVSSEISIKNSSSNDAVQLGKSIGIQNYLARGEHPLEFGGLQIDPDLGWLLIDTLSAKRYDLVIEFGSGTATILMAKMIANLHKTYTQTSGKLLPQVFAFEHVLKRQERTMSMVEQEGLQHIAKVHFAPLETYREGNGAPDSYYSYQEALSEISRKWSLGVDARILVLVNGPPDEAHLMARLPALDVLKKFFPTACMEFILNGYRQPNERTIAETWARECTRSGVPFSLEEVQTERGCAIFRYRG